MKTKSKLHMRPAGRLPLTDKCHHYLSRSQLPHILHKYWHQRYDIFSLYDDDIYLTNDAWFGVTPELIAKRVAKDFHAQNPQKSILIDCFAGAGGNAIAFALSGHFSRVIAIEHDPSALACAQHNAEVYGLETEITWVLGDSFEFLRNLLAAAAADDVDGYALQPHIHCDLRVPLADTAIFASPPWGGPGYTSDAVFDLTRMQPYGLNELESAYFGLGHALYLPRTSDIRQLAALAPAKRRIQATQYCLRGASKAMVAYIPAKPARPLRIAQSGPAPRETIVFPLTPSVTGIGMDNEMETLSDDSSSDDTSSTSSGLDPKQ